MDAYSVFTFTLLFVGSMAQPTQVGLTGPGAPVTEGTDPAITLTCTLNSPAMFELSFPLQYVSTSTTENGFDHPDINARSCIVAPGDTVGTVIIPLIDDVVIDAPAGGESLTVSITDTRGLFTPMGAGMTTVTVLDDGDNVPLLITPRDLLHSAKELAMAATDSFAAVTLDFIDACGDLAPLEEDITVSVTKVNSALDTATAGTDFTDVTMWPIAYTAGMTETSALMTVRALNDNDIENMETVSFVLGDMTAAVAGSITAVGSPAFQVQFGDDDRTELIAIQDMTPLSRRSKADVTIWAVSSEPGGGGWDIADSTLGHSLVDVKRKVRTINTRSALQLTIPRPKKNSKRRINEFTFTRTQSFGPNAYERTVRSYLTSTSHGEGQAPIETDVNSIITVYPDAQPCSTLDQAYCITVRCTDLNRRQLRWSFIPVDGSNSDETLLRRYNGMTRIPITGCDRAGLYIVSRQDRREIGWVDFVRVIQAVCPRGMYDLGGTCTSSNVGSCLNQGILDQTLNVCTCTPGFTGTHCQLEQAPGTFGSNNQFQVRDYFRGNLNGKCITFSYPDTFGATCAAGFQGKDCCDQCKRGCNFGANCAQTCHCIDSMCDPFSGRCANGCASGYNGFNCQ